MTPVYKKYFLLNIHNIKYKTDNKNSNLNMWGLHMHINHYSLLYHNTRTIFLKSHYNTCTQLNLDIKHIIYQLILNFKKTSKVFNYTFLLVLRFSWKKVIQYTIITNCRWYFYWVLFITLDTSCKHFIPKSV